MSGRQLCKDVYLKFIHNINVQGNHYEPLLNTEERKQCEKVHQDIIEIFREDSNDEKCLQQNTSQHTPPVQTSEQFLNEHEDDVIYIQEIPNEDGCVLTIENPEEVICTGQGLLDEQQIEVSDNENKQEVT